MQIKSTGIVFRAVKYGETSVIADIFTEEKGLHTFIGGGVRTAKAKMPFSLFQPMMVVELVAYFRDDPGAMNRLRELRASEVWKAIPFDIKRGAITLFMAEICRKCIQETEENRELFEYLLRVLRWLDATTLPIVNVHLHFLIELSGHLGFQPQFEPDDAQGERFFDLKEGIFLPVPPPSALYLQPDMTATLIAFLETPLEYCHEIQLSRAERKVFLGKLLQFYELHVPGFSGMNSPEILELVMG
ncbi:MAG: DNA repair protein RecO [Saprospiraceae bacterium]|nr:DNA repair protein RecO [Saprospiraceae bacterium]